MGGSKLAATAAADARLVPTTCSSRRRYLIARFLPSQRFLCLTASGTFWRSRARARVRLRYLAASSLFLVANGKANLWH